MAGGRAKRRLWGSLWAQGNKLHVKEMSLLVPQKNLTAYALQASFEMVTFAGRAPMVRLAVSGAMLRMCLRLCQGLARRIPRAGSLECFQVLCRCQLHRLAFTSANQHRNVQERLKVDSHSAVGIEDLMWSRARVVN